MKQDHALKVYEHWLEYGSLVRHRAFTPKMRKAVCSRLKDRGLKAVLQAVSRYAELCAAGCAPGHNGWSLSELCSRGEGEWIDRLLDPRYEGMGGGQTRGRRKGKFPHPIRIFREAYPTEVDRRNRRRWMKERYERALRLAHRLDPYGTGPSLEFQSQLASSLVELDRFVYRSLKTMPEHLHFVVHPVSVGSYLDWLEEQRWLEAIGPKVFDPRGKLFRMFRREAAKTDAMERDPLTGEPYF